MHPDRWSRSQVLATVVPALLLGLPLLILGIAKPFKITEALSSWQAMAILTGIGVLWLALMLVLYRFVGPVWRGVSMGVVSVLVAAVLVVPSVRDVKVVESRDDLAAVRTEPVPTVPASPPASDPPASDTTVPPATGTTDPPVETGPVHVATGSLRGIGHGASGTTNLFSVTGSAGAGGSGSSGSAAAGQAMYVVELLDIDIEPGPDYFVHLVPGYGNDSPGDGSIDLGALKGNLGTQYYDVPPGSDITGEWSLIVWCRAFSVPVAAADLLPV